jgi:hypothetical protein
MNHGDAARFRYMPHEALEITFHTGNGHEGDVGFLPILPATLHEAGGVWARTRRGARTNKEHALSSRVTFTTIPPFT